MKIAGHQIQYKQCGTGSNFKFKRASDVACDVCGRAYRVAELSS